MPHWDWLIMAVFLAIGWLAPHLGERWFHSLETFFSKIAARRTAAVALIFFSTIVLRLALLPVMPVAAPGIADEFSYLLMGDTFAHGRLANPTPPLWVSFESFHINMLPTYSSMYPPAQGFVLMLGQLLGHPWIGVLLSVAALCAALVWMLQAWIPARWAFLGGVIAVLKFGLISYWMNSYWGGAVAAAGGALVLGALGRILRRPRTRDALLLGLGVAILANSRPYEGLVFCVPAAGAFLLWLKRRSSLPWSVKLRRIVLPLAACLALTGAFIAYYNWRLTGDALLMPHVLNNRTYRSTGEFIWDHTKPPLHYRNRQFEVAYNLFFRNYYQGTWNDLKRITANKIKLYNEVFLWLGAVPLLCCLPLTFGDRHKRLLLVELALSILGFFPVVWFYPHYQAPALCVLYALLLQTLRHIRTFSFNGRPVGRGSPAPYSCSCSLAWPYPSPAESRIFLTDSGTTTRAFWNGLASPGY